MRVVFSAAASGDLREIARFIARRRPATARRVVAELRAAARSLGTYPELGRARPELRPAGYRSLAVLRWVVFYRILGDRVEVVRVLDGSRDLDEAL